jgi:hypothetical protein
MSDNTNLAKDAAEHVRDRTVRPIVIKEFDDTHPQTSRRTTAVLISRACVTLLLPSAGRLPAQVRLPGRHWQKPSKHGPTDGRNLPWNNPDAPKLEYPDLSQLEVFDEGLVPNKKSCDTGRIGSGDSRPAYHRSRSCRGLRKSHQGGPYC